MPCVVDVPDTTVEDLRAQVKNLSAMLCEAMSYIEETEYVYVDFLSDNVVGWWRAHQEADRRRLQRTWNDLVSRLTDEEAEALDWARPLK